MSLIFPNFDVKSIFFPQFWPEAFSQNCWEKPCHLFEKMYIVSYTDIKEGQVALNRLTEFCLKLTYRYLLKADHVPCDFLALGA